ncbi:hypothetical protein SRHO_G00338230 [Serrasalmus rhombeus]
MKTRVSAQTGREPCLPAQTSGNLAASSPAGSAQHCLNNVWTVCIIRPQAVSAGFGLQNRGGGWRDTHMEEVRMCAGERLREPDRCTVSFTCGGFAYITFTSATGRGGKSS